MSKLSQTSTELVPIVGNLLINTPFEMMKVRQQAGVVAQTGIQSLISDSYLGRTFFMVILYSVVRYLLWRFVVQSDPVSNKQHELQDLVEYNVFGSIFNPVQSRFLAHVVGGTLSSVVILALLYPLYAVIRLLFAQNTFGIDAIKSTFELAGFVGVTKDLYRGFGYAALGILVYQFAHGFFRNLFSLDLPGTARNSAVDDEKKQMKELFALIGAIISTYPLDTLKIHMITSEMGHSGSLYAGAMTALVVPIILTIVGIVSLKVELK